MDPSGDKPPQADRPEEPTGGVFHTPFTPEDPNEDYVPMKSLQPMRSAGVLPSVTKGEPDYSNRSTPRETSRKANEAHPKEVSISINDTSTSVMKDSTFRDSMVKGQSGRKMSFITLRHRQRALKDVAEGPVKDDAIASGHVHPQHTAPTSETPGSKARLKAARPPRHPVDGTVKEGDTEDDNPLGPAVTRYLNKQRKRGSRRASSASALIDAPSRRKAAPPKHPGEGVTTAVEVEQHAEADDAMPDADHIDAQRLTTDQTTGETKYLIDTWEQSVVEYLFPSAFDEEIDYGELLVILVQLGSVMLNVVMVGINVFYNDLDNPNYTIRVLSRIAFISELVIVWLAFLLLIVVAIHGVLTGNVGTNLVVDLVDVSSFTMSFSTLQVVTYSGPPRVMRNIAAQLKSAYSVCDYVLVGVFVIFSFAGFLCATVIVVLKVTQVDFLFKGDLFAWTWMEFIQLFGLVNNLAGLDLSYQTQTITLLQSLHHHYCAPGGPDSPDVATEGLFSRLTHFLGVTRFNRTYEYIESIFDAHFGLRTNLNATQKAKFTFNFMAFILRLDTGKLEQLLQMVRSPLIYYSCERAAFKEALERGDLTAMRAAVARADPLTRQTIELGKSNPTYFRLIYACDNPSMLVEEDVNKNGDTSSVPAIIFS